MTPTAAYLIGWDMCSAYRSILDGRLDLADAMLDSARERLERAVRDEAKDHDVSFIAATRADIERYDAKIAALRGDK